MFLARKGNYPDEFTKIAYVLSYMKGGSAGIWSKNFTKARNTADNWEEYTWKPTARKTSMRKKISTDFEEFNKQADARDKLARLNPKKMHFLRGLKWELARGIYQDPAASDTWDKLVAKAKRHETMCIEETCAHNLYQGKYQVFTPSNYYTAQAPPRQDRESQYIPIDIDVAEMEADAICTHFKKLIPEERT